MRNTDETKLDRALFDDSGVLPDSLAPSGRYIRAIREHPALRLLLDRPVLFSPRDRLALRAYVAHSRATYAPHGLSPTGPGMVGPSCIGRRLPRHDSVHGYLSRGRTDFQGNGQRRYLVLRWLRRGGCRLLCAPVLCAPAGT